MSITGVSLDKRISLGVELPIHNVVLLPPGENQWTAGDTIRYFGGRRARIGHSKSGNRLSSGTFKWEGGRRLVIRR